MTLDQVVLVVSQYEEGLPEAQRFDGEFPTREQALQHARWMIVEVKNYAAAGEIEKAMRWLGFLQGVLWLGGVRTIQAMREDNRSRDVPQDAV